MDDQTLVGVGPTVRYQHAVREITTSAGLEAASQIEIVFDPSYERLTLHDLSVWREGRRLDRTDRKVIKLLQRETQLERQMVDGRYTASIVLEDLRVGDRIEWAASVTGDNPVFEGRFVDTQWTSSSRGPVGLVSRRLVAPANRNIQHRLNAPGVEVDERRRTDGVRDVVLRRTAVPHFRYDPMTPAEDYFADQLEWSEFASWAEVASWAERQFGPALRDTAPLAEKAAEIKAASDDPARRLELALDFVQREIRYFGTEVGASSHRPASAGQVLRLRFGDCKDKAALLVNLLSQLDIEAVPALVSTVLRQRMATRLPSPLAFDHAIVAVMQGSDWLWLDATRSLQTGAAVERAVSGLSAALMARAGERALVDVPKSRPRIWAEHLDVFSYPRLAEPGTLVSQVTYHGDLAERMRAARASQAPEAFEAMVVSDLARSYPSFRSLGSAQVEEISGKNAVRITQRLSATNEVWRLMNSSVMATEFALYGVMGPLRLPDLTPREQALALPRSGTYRHTVRFEFGETVYGKDSEMPFSDSGPHFELRLRTKGGTRMAEIQADLLMTAERLEASQWLSHRDRLQKLWPRLSNQIAVPAIAPDRAEGLRSELKSLGERMRSGKVKVTTRVQANAQFDLLAKEAVLAAQRLPTKLQARVQTQRGQHLDHLGRTDEAGQAFAEAVRLDPTSSEAYAALAVNALLRGQDQASQAAAEKALTLSPSEPAPRYTRAQARYMAGDFSGASADLRDLLLQAGGSDAERGYRAVWLYLSQTAQGQDGRAATDAQTGSVSSWPQPILRMLRGEQSMKDALSVAGADKDEQAGRECELYFFAAQKALLDRDPELARRWLDRSIATDVKEFVEYALARRERERLSGRP